MKKIFILILISIILTTTASAFISVTKAGGGKNGYDYVSEEHDGSFHTLSCSGEGYAPCEWTVKPEFTGPNSVAPWEDLEQYAITQVQAGNLQGTYTNNVEINGDLWNRSVQWDGQDTLNIDIDLNIQLVTYPN